MLCFEPPLARTGHKMCRVVITTVSFRHVKASMRKVIMSHRNGPSCGPGVPGRRVLRRERAGQRMPIGRRARGASLDECLPPPRSRPASREPRRQPPSADRAAAPLTTADPTDRALCIARGTSLCIAGGQPPAVSTDLTGDLGDGRSPVRVSPTARSSRARRRRRSRQGASGPGPARRSRRGLRRHRAGPRSTTRDAATA
jgi:hypothetical protein